MSHSSCGGRENGRAATHRTVHTGRAHLHVVPERRSARQMVPHTLVLLLHAQVERFLLPDVTTGRQHGRGPRLALVQQRRQGLAWHRVACPTTCRGIVAGKQAVGDGVLRNVAGKNRRGHAADGPGVFWANLSVPPKTPHTPVPHRRTPRTARRPSCLQTLPSVRDPCAAIVCGRRGRACWSRSVVSHHFFNALCRAAPRGFPATVFAGDAVTEVQSLLAGPCPPLLVGRTP